jgi:hypothetical protein
MMEAMRISRRSASSPAVLFDLFLWTGEEQGLLGSRAYVKQHFGYRGDGTLPLLAVAAAQSRQNQAALFITKLPEYDKLSLFQHRQRTGMVRGLHAGQ